MDVDPVDRSRDPRTRGRDAARPPDRATERRLWFGILAPPAAWTAAELVGYALVGRTCGAGGPAAGPATWQWTALFSVTASAAAVTLGAMAIAYGVFRRRTGGAPLTRTDARDRVEFMAAGGVILGSMLLLNIVYFGIMPMIVDPCLRTT